MQGLAADLPSVEDMLKLLEVLEDATFMHPTMPLNGTFKKFRQAAYKLKHKHKSPSE